LAGTNTIAYFVWLGKANGLLLRGDHWTVDGLTRKYYIILKNLAGMNTAYFVLLGKANGLLFSVGHWTVSGLTRKYYIILKNLAGTNTLF
jgi:hypothetical protein